MQYLFDAIPKNDRDEVILDRGESVFLQGDTTRGMFAVMEGKVQLQRHTEAGVVVIIHTARNGETFAEASLFSDHFHCDAVAIEPSRIVRFDQERIINMLASNPDFAVTITRQFAIQIQSYRRRLEILSISSAKERVYAGIADRMLKSDIKSFASKIGLTHETTYRALAELVATFRIKKTGYGKYEL